MKRKLFCQICPLTYKISTYKCRLIKNIKDSFGKEDFAKEFSEEKLPFLIYSNKSLIRRKLGNVEPELQENKAVNLSLAAPKVNGILIKPGETFSFWHLVGNCREKDGYKIGLTISGGETTKGIGGGMCQFTNLIHWLVLHTPLEITEHHHHDGIDLFPDYGRQIPFGTGTSIVYNYLDYRFKNNTDITFQINIYTDDKYLCGEIRADKKPTVKYHIKTENEKFIREGNDVFRTGKIYRETIDTESGKILRRELIKENHAKLMYEIEREKISNC